MTGNHIEVGLSLLLLTLGLCSVRYFRCRRQAPMPVWGWIGLAGVLFTELFLFLQVNWVRVYFTPLVWTGYVLLTDGLVGTLRGRSRLGQSPREFLWLAFSSVPLWLIFEAYNLRLRNWTYVGLPDSQALRTFGYAWSFATIWPAIYETADLLRALNLGSKVAPWRLAFRPRVHASLFALGLVMVTVPVLVPPRVGSHLFGAIWLGFILLLDPVNHCWGGRSLLRDLEQGRTHTLYPFALSGLVCGILWEFWNNGASAKWLYVFPIWQQWKIFEMPLPGYLGFPPFALECFVMFEFLIALRKRLREIGRGALGAPAGLRPPKGPDCTGAARFGPQAGAQRFDCRL